MIKKYSFEKLDKSLNISNFKLSNLEEVEKERINLNLNALVKIMFTDKQIEIFDYYFALEHNISFRKISQKVGLTFQCCEWHIKKMIERLKRKDIMNILLNSKTEDVTENEIPQNELSKNQGELPIEFLKLNRTSYEAFRDFFGFVYIKDILNGINDYNDFLKTKLGVANVKHILDRLDTIGVDYESEWGEFDEFSLRKGIEKKYRNNKKAKKQNAKDLQK